MGLLIHFGRYRLPSSRPTALQITFYGSSNHSGQNLMSKKFNFPSLKPFLRLKSPSRSLLVQASNLPNSLHMPWLTRITNSALHAGDDWTNPLTWQTTLLWSSLTCCKSSGTESLFAMHSQPPSLQLELFSLSTLLNLQVTTHGERFTPELYLKKSRPFFWLTNLPF